MTSACLPNLPRGMAKTVICGDHPAVRATLEQRGAEVLTVGTSTLLPVPVADHADMLCCHAAENTVVTADGALADELAARGVRCSVPSTLPGGSYPDDVALNCLVVGGYAFGRKDSTVPELLEIFDRSGTRFVSVKPGYSRCSVAVVDEGAVMTADRGMHAALTAAGFDVLLISPGGIILEGYDTGFIGGCCGKLSRDRMLFCGDPLRHPDGERITGFLDRQGVKAERTHDGELVDFGGFITIFCEQQPENLVHTH